MDTLPKEYTKEETRERLIAKLWTLIYYWDKLPGKSSKDRLIGLTHSILATLDGCSPDVPMCLIIPAPAEEDKGYHISNGENYFPRDLSESGDIGPLHDYLFKKRKE